MFKTLSCIKYSSCCRNPNHHGEYTERDVSGKSGIPVRDTWPRRGHRIRGWGKNCNNEQPNSLVYSKSHFYRFCLCLSSTHQNLKVHIIPSLDFPHTLPSVWAWHGYHTTFARLSRWISPSMCLWRSPAWQGGGNHSTWPSKKPWYVPCDVLTHDRNVRPGYTVTWLAAVDRYLPQFPLYIPFCGWTQRL